MSACGVMSKSIDGRSRSAECVGAVVTGADYRGLGIVRSLGRHGLPVWVLRDRGHFLAATSRYSSRSLNWPGGHESRQIDFLRNLAEREGLQGWTLFPTTDEIVMLVAHHHQSLAEYYRLTTPPWEALRWVCDKRLLHQLAQIVGVNRPCTFFPRNREELSSLRCEFPVILKPALRRWGNRFTDEKAWYIGDRATLLQRYEEACSLVNPEIVMVQEFVPGRGEAQFSYAALCENGEPIASIVARRVRQFPEDFGRFSTYVETVDDPEVAEPAARLLAAIGFTGIAEVEFKWDARDGKYKVLDVNPRVWGWHTLSKRAGVDFPYLLWMLAQGEAVDAVHARAGERWMRFATDVPMALGEILNGRLPILEYLRSLRTPSESAIFAWDDPLPGLLEPVELAVAFGRRALLEKGIWPRRPMIGHKQEFATPSLTTPVKRYWNPKSASTTELVPRDAAEN
jgi:D-aspartate ligase